LIGVHEIDRDIFEDLDANWGELGYSDLTQIHFDIGAVANDYDSRIAEANLRGSTTAFVDADGQLRSVIVLYKNIKTTSQHGKLKYVLKIASLLHEIGHVEDLEKGINFDVENAGLDIIEAEIFAHLWALERMAKSGYCQSYDVLLGGLKDAINDKGYRGNYTAQLNRPAGPQLFRPCGLTACSAARGVS